MKNEDIKKSFVTKVQDLMGHYPNVSFKYAYIPDRNVYFVSYQVESAIEDNDPLWDDMYDMIQSLDDEFGDKAPLFSEGDRTFRLPANAETIYPKFSVIKKNRQIRVPARTSLPARP